MWEIKVVDLRSLILTRIHDMLNKIYMYHKMSISLACLLGIHAIF